MYKKKKTKKSLTGSSLDKISSFFWLCPKALLVYQWLYRLIAALLVSLLEG